MDVNPGPFSFKNLLYLYEYNSSVGASVFAWVFLREIGSMFIYFRSADNQKTWSSISVSIDVSDNNHHVIKVGLTPAPLL